jgi:hypothetical protein
MAKDYHIQGATGRCGACGAALAPGTEYVATIWPDDDDFRRRDYCPACWNGGDEQRRGRAFGVWRTRVPAPRPKRRLFVDDGLLVNFFERLAGEQDPARVSFRFVLALILMRKKLLVYDRTDAEPDGTETWTMHLRADGTTHRVTNPRMDDEKIAQVSRKLNDILQGECE